MEGAYQVIGPVGLNLNRRRIVKTEVFGPDSTVLYQEEVYMESLFSAKAQLAGKYYLCFTNVGHIRGDLHVDVSFFTLSHFRDADALKNPKGIAKKRKQEIAKVEDFQEVEQIVQRLKEMLHTIRGEQIYMKKHFKRSFGTRKSMQAKTLFYAFLQIVALLAITGMQVFFIQRLFMGKRKGMIEI